MALPPLNIEFSIDDDRWHSLEGALQQMEKSMHLAYEQGYKNSPFTIPPQTPCVEISVVLCDDGDIQNLNRDYRGKDSPTNVLSFALMDGDNHTPMIEGMPYMLGDMIMAFDTMAREAHQQNKTMLSHICHLSIHGTLHLLGYDHMSEDDAHSMETLEIDLLKTLGINDPYAPIDDD